MAYINAEKSKQIRETLKREFSTKDGWQFSVTIANYSSLYVTILKAPINFGVEKYQSVNQYYITRDFEGEAAAALTRIVDICNDGNYNNSDPMTDYFDFGWYFSLKIGDYDRPFQFVEKKGYQYNTVESQPTTSDESEFYCESVESFKYWFDKPLFDKEINCLACEKENDRLENQHLLLNYRFGELIIFDQKAKTKHVLNQENTPKGKIFDPERLKSLYFEFYYHFNENTTIDQLLEISDQLQPI